MVIFLPLLVVNSSVFSCAEARNVESGRRKENTRILKETNFFITLIFIMFFSFFDGFEGESDDEAGTEEIGGVESDDAA